MGALLGLFALLAVPFVLLAVAVKVFFGLMLLPFRIVGAAAARACSASSAGSSGWRRAASGC